MSDYLTNAVNLERWKAESLSNLRDVLYSLNISSRTANAIGRYVIYRGVCSIEELEDLPDTELAKGRGIGKKAVMEFRQALKEAREYGKL